jgi:hypothetical protein
MSASIYVSEKINRQLVNISQELAYKAVNYCAERYNFNAEEVCKELGLGLIKVERKKEGKSKAEKVSVSIISVTKPSIPLPYNGEMNEQCCLALRQNNGLYTQCTGGRRDGSNYCKGCAGQMQKLGTEVPEYGTIEMRKAVGVFEYVDPKGRKPVAYTKVMKKYKLTQEQVMEEAKKLNMEILAEHFEVAEETKRGRPKTVEKETKEKGTRGRPKKSKKVLEIDGGNNDDLFATLVANANEEVSDAKSDAKSDVKSEDANEKAEKLAAEKAEKLAAEKAEKLAAEKAEKLAKKEAERLAREEEKALKKAAAEQAKKEKELAAEQAKKEKELAAEQAKKEKEAKLAAKEAAKKEKVQKEKVPKKAAEKVPSAEKKVQKKAAEKVSSDNESGEKEEEADVVKKIEFEGKKYLKSKKTGIIYDYEEYAKNGEQVVVGKWNDKSKKIDFNAVEEEEEEEEYDQM